MVDGVDGEPGVHALPLAIWEDRLDPGHVTTPVRRMEALLVMVKRLE